MSCFYLSTVCYGTIYSCYLHPNIYGCVIILDHKWF